MFVTLTDDRSGEVLLQRELHDIESLRPEVHALEFGNACGYTVDSSPGLVPDGCGDFTVEVAEEPQSAVCWARQSFFWAAE